MCNQPLAAADAERSRTPLWQQLDRYLRFPFSPQWLPVALIWAGLAALLPPLWISVAVVLLGGLPAMGIGSAVLAERGRERSSRSRRATTSGWRALTPLSRWRTALFQGLPVLVVLAGSGVLLLTVSVSAGLLVGGLLLLLVPAIWLAVEVEGAGPGAYAAMPGLLLSASRDGLVAALFASLGWMLCVALISVAMDLLPMPAVQALAAGLAGCWWLALSALCGDLLARHGRRWGYQGAAVPRATEPLDQRRERVQLAAGAFDRVLIGVSKTLKGKKATLADWQQHDRLLAVLGREDERRRRREDYLDVLIGAEAWQEALALLARQRREEPQWLPGSAGLRLALARGVADSAPKVAVQLLKDLHEQHPGFDGVGEAYLLLAQILAEQFGLAGKAEQYLRFVESHCRDAKLRQQVARCREAWA
ncbi:hypothetical protein A11A3_02782 [Alcanivorax hongdengensis A-11-3]|uniref:Transmembrane protein n=1 Tax=Alcanivorax hongdengensis A-11-3 TaxID=1177179 RepID=L0WGB2_9GAMM|nr:hypothetical protein A11A3_02782 [Alcanivorax hongdengensis A-11-3]